MKRPVTRHTRQRQFTLEVLKQTASHPTASELHAMLLPHLPQISLGTVYRNLGVLARMGLVRRLDAGAGRARFDGNPQQHAHIRCLSCGRMADAELPGGGVLEESRPGNLEEVNGYRVVSVRVDLIGVCPECRIQAGQQGDQRTRFREV